MAFDLAGFGSLLGGLGGLFGGRNTTKESWKGSYGSIVGHAQGAIEGYKRTGINPLTLLGVTPSSGLQGQNYFGQAVADAGMLLADAFASSRDVGRLERAERLNEKLRQQVTDLTLRPAVPGVYGAGNGGSGNASVSDGASRGVSVDGPRGLPPDGGIRPLIDRDAGSMISDPRRPVDNDPVKSHSGTIIVDNPALPVPLRVPTLDGDEALQWYDYPSLALPGAIALGDFLRSPAFGPPEGYARDGYPLQPVKPREGLKLEAAKPPEKVRYKTVMRNGKRVRVRKSAWDK